MALVLALTVTACASLDVVGNSSVTAFDAVIQALPDKVTADAARAGWALSAPDSSARFVWSADYGASPRYDVLLEFDAQPFLDAGLDPDKLPDNYAFYADGAGVRLLVGKKFGGADRADDASSPLSAYALIADKHRDAVNYHTALDHFGVMLGDGNMFEWAKNMETNGYDGSVQDKDIVFVLNPGPLIAAGADPERVAGWAYAQVLVDENGKAVQVWKLLKPFDLA